MIGHCLRDAGAAKRQEGPYTGGAHRLQNVAQIRLLGSIICRPPLPRTSRMRWVVMSGQGAMALHRKATISTSLSGPAHCDRICQKGRVTSLHNPKGHRHVRVRRGFDKYAQIQGMQGKIHGIAKIFCRRRCKRPLAVPFSTPMRQFAHVDEYREDGLLPAVSGDSQPGARPAPRREPGAGRRFAPARPR